MTITSPLPQFSYDYPFPLPAAPVARGLVLTPRVAQRAAKLLPPAARKTFAADYALLVGRFVPRVLKGSSVASVFTQLATMAPQTHPRLAAMVNQCPTHAQGRAFDASALSLTDLNLYGQLAKHDTLLGLMTSSTSLYQASDKVLDGASLPVGASRGALAAARALAVCTADADLVWMALGHGLPDGCEPETLLTSGAALRHLCLARYALAREIAGRAHVEPKGAQQGELAVTSLRDGRRTFVLREPVFVDVSVQAGGATATMHELDLHEAGSTSEQAMTALRAHFGALWDDMVANRAATLDAEALRWRLWSLVASVEGAA